MKLDLETIEDVSMAGGQKNISRGKGFKHHLFPVINPCTAGIIEFIEIFN